MVENFIELIEKKRFIRTLEAPPPKTAQDLDRYLESLADLDGGIDFINVPDGLHPHYDSLEAAYRVQEEVGKPAILHVTCRGSREKINSHLLDAHGAGVRNLIVIKGDGHMGEGFKESHELIEYISGLNNSYNGHRPDFSMAAALDPYRPEKEEAEKACRKVLAGTGTFFTQPVFDIDLFLNWLNNVKGYFYDRQGNSNGNRKEFPPVIVGGMHIPSSKAMSYAKSLMGVRFSGEIEKRLEGKSDQEISDFFLEKGKEVYQIVFEEGRKHGCFGFYGCRQRYNFEGMLEIMGIGEGRKSVARDRVTAVG